MKWLFFNGRHLSGCELMINIGSQKRTKEVNTPETAISVFDDGLNNLTSARPIEVGRSMQSGTLHIVRHPIACDPHSTR
jgi:hypothetical protein